MGTLLLHFLLVVSSLRAPLDGRVIPISETDLLERTSHLISQTSPFKEISSWASEQKIRIWALGGMASSITFRAKLSALCKNESHPHCKSIKSHENAPIVQQGQDVDLVVDGDASILSQVEKFVIENYPHFLWEIRPLKGSWTQKDGRRFDGILEEDFQNQNTDSHSIGLVRLDKTSVDSLITDAYKLASTQPSSSAFLHDLLKSQITFFRSPHHSNNSRARIGLNPELLSVIRFLIKVAATDSSIPEASWNTLNLISQPISSKVSQEAYVENWFQRHFDKLVNYSINAERTFSLLESLGLGNLARKYNPVYQRKPLESFRVGKGKGETAVRLGFSKVYHETFTFDAFRSLTLSPFGAVNAFISRNGVVDETAAFGDGFYVSTIEKGYYNGRGIVIPLTLLPEAREGTDFLTPTKDIIVVLNKAALRTVPDNEFLPSPFYIAALIHDNLDKEPSKLAYDQLRRQILALDNDQVQKMFSKVKWKAINGNGVLRLLRIVDDRDFFVRKFRSIFKRLLKNGITPASDSLSKSIEIGFEFSPTFWNQLVRTPADYIRIIQGVRTKDAKTKPSLWNWLNQTIPLRAQLFNKDPQYYSDLMEEVFSVDENFGQRFFTVILEEFLKTPTDAMQFIHLANSLLSQARDKNIIESILSKIESRFSSSLEFHHWLRKNVINFSSEASLYTIHIWSKDADSTKKIQQFLEKSKDLKVVFDGVRTLTTKSSSPKEFFNALKSASNVNPIILVNTSEYLSKFSELIAQSTEHFLSLGPSILDVMNFLDQYQFHMTREDYIKVRNYATPLVKTVSQFGKLSEHFMGRNSLKPTLHDDEMWVLKNFTQLESLAKNYDDWLVAIRSLYYFQDRRANPFSVNQKLTAKLARNLVMHARNPRELEFLLFDVLLSAFLKPRVGTTLIKKIDQFSDEFTLEDFIVFARNFATSLAPKSLYSLKKILLKRCSTIQEAFKVLDVYFSTRSSGEFMIFNDQLILEVARGEVPLNSPLTEEDFMALGKLIMHKSSLKELKVLAKKGLGNSLCSKQLQLLAKSKW